MLHDFAPLARALNAYSPMPLDEVESLARAARSIEFQKGAVLLRQGDPVDWLGFLERGLLRNVARQGERDVNLGFELEGAFVGAYDAYLRRGPAGYEIEALEPGRYLRFERAVLDRLISEREPWREPARRVAEVEFARTTERHRMRSTSTPAARYPQLERTRSELLRRVPQYHLASWIGVTPEALSRIRSRTGNSAGS